MFSKLDMNPMGAAINRSTSIRDTLRSVMSLLLEGIRSGRFNEENQAKCMELYHADESKLRDMGLTRMDVVRLLEANQRRAEQRINRSA